MTITNEQLVGELIPSVYVSRILLDSDTNDRLKVNIQLVLKHTYGNDQISSWLEDRQILQYLKVFVIQSTEQQITNVIENVFNSEARSFFTSEQSFQIAKSILQRNGISNVEEGLQYKKLDLFSLNTSIRQLEQNGQAELTIDTNGEKIYNIYLDIDFQLSEKNPKHLSYYFGTIYDLASLIGDIEGVSETANTIGEIKIETVIVDSQILETSFVYLTQDNEIWPGSIHIITREGEQIYRTGEFESVDSIDLERVEIRNYKVQDFRQVKFVDLIKLEEINIPESDILLFFDNINSIQNYEKQLISLKDNSSISQGFTSIDSDGNGSITFFIDFKKMFIKNSFYGQVLSKINSLASKRLINIFYKLTKIESLILYKKRIDIDDSLFLKKEQKQIVQSLDEQQIQQQIKSTYFSFDRQQQIFTFSIVDDLKNEKGKYEYDVEIHYNTVGDIQRELNTQISLLKLEQEQIKNYYNFAISPDVFNTITNRFKIGAFRELPVPEVNKIISILQNYFEIPQNQLDDIRNELYFKLLSPINGTPDSILYAIKFYQQIIDSLQQTVSFTKFVNNSLNEKNSANNTEERVESIANIIQINKNLNCNINVDNNYLLEYLNDTRIDSSGLFDDPFLYENLKIDLISKKLDQSKKLTRVNNTVKQNIQIFDKLYNILGENSDIKITLETDSISETNNNSINSRLESADRASLNTFMLSLIAPTVDKSSQNIEIIFDTSDYNNIFWDITPNLATINNRNIVNLFKNCSINIDDDAKKLPNQIKKLIKDRISFANTNSVPIGDGEVRFKYEMIKQVERLTNFPYDNSGFQTFDMQRPQWNIIDNSTINFMQSLRDKMFFCRMKDYVNNKIKYKFNLSLKEHCINEHFMINTMNITQNNKIVDGVTQLTLNNYKLLCDNQTKNFFNSATPDVNYTIANVSVNDSYQTTLYGYLSLHGIQFDEHFRTILLPNQTSIDSELISETELITEVSPPLSRIPIQTDQLENLDNTVFERIPPAIDNIFGNVTETFADPRISDRSPPIDNLFINNLNLQSSTQIQTISNVPLIEITPSTSAEISNKNIVNKNASRNFEQAIVYSRNFR